MAAGESAELYPGAATPAGRPDAFICYAREDAEIVAALRDGLLGRGKSVWVDRSDIPFSAPWRTRARDGIDASKAVVFVLSAHWADSAPCAFEFEHARAVHKRLIPVVVGPEPATDQLPAELAALAWIPLPEIGLEAAVAALAETLDADLAWREAQTRLLVHAVEWDRDGRRASALLRGSELRAAERWLDTRPQREAGPTVLQSEYVLASRRAAARRQRLMLAAAGVAAAVSLTLGGLAYWQRGVAVERRRYAVEQRDAALRNARQSRSRELAATANARRAENVDLALLLALEGFRVARTAEARSALAGALAAASPLRMTLRVRRAPMLFSVAYAPDGRTLASTGANETVLLWDARRGVKVGALSLTDRGVAVAFDPADPRRLASASADGVVRLWRLGGRRPSSLVLERAAGPALDVAFAPDGGRLAIGDADGRVRVRDLRTRRRIAWRGHRGQIAALAFGSDGRTLVSAGAEDGALRLWDGARGRSLGPRLPSRLRSPRDVVFDPSGRLLAAAGADGAVEVWDWRRRRMLGSVSGGRDPVLSIAFVGPRRLALAGGDRRIRLVAAPWRRLSGPALRAHTAAVESLAVDPRRPELASAGLDGTVRVWSITPAPPLASTIRRRQLRWPRHSIAAFTYSGDGSTAALIDGAGRILSWKSGRETARMHHPGGEVIALSPYGERLASAGLDGTVRLWDTRSGRSRGILLRTNAPTSALAFDPRGSLLAAGGNDGKVRLLGMPGMRTLAVGADRITALGFDRSGRVLAVATATGSVQLWDPRRGRRTGPAIAAHDADVVAVALGDDLRTLASVGDQGDLRLWDAPRGRLIVQPPARLGRPPVALGFDRSGALASRGADGRIIHWDPLLASVDFGAWRARVCRLAGRGLDRAEWEQYLPGEPFRPACAAAQPTGTQFGSPALPSMP